VVSSPRVKPPARWLAAFPLTVTVLLLVLTSCHKKPSELIQGDNSTDYGTPNAIAVPAVPGGDNPVDIAFALIADTHLDCSNAAWFPWPAAPWPGGYPFRDTPDALRNRDCVYFLNAERNVGDWAPLRGVVHVGDMIDSHTSVQNLIAFRQYWEHDYPGKSAGSIAGASDSDYTAYSGRYRTELVMLPGLGNHDDGDSESDVRYAVSYFSDLIWNATGIKRYYMTHVAGAPVVTAYAWRWGKYYFVQLGQWGGNPPWEDPKGFERAKLEWLEDALAEDVGDSLAVVVFQHYGWDQNGSQDFWPSGAKRMLLNVLCRRPIDDTTWWQAYQHPPYAVMGIFTGHTHAQEYRKVYAGVMRYDTLDPHGDTIWFNNVVLRATGKTDPSDYFGFSIVEMWGGYLPDSWWFDRMQVRDIKTMDGNYWIWGLQQFGYDDLWWYQWHGRQRGRGFARGARRTGH
jgi:hypothetical protein